MRRLYSTVTKKVAIGYLVIVFFSLLAIGFALFRLDQQTAQAQSLVSVDFRAFELVRDLQQNLLAQDNIEKQLLILRDPALSELRINRNEALSGFSHALSQPPFASLYPHLNGRLQEYREFDDKLSDALLWQDWESALAVSKESTVPIRSHLLKLLAETRQQQQLRINEGLADLSEKSDEAYRLTLSIALVGIFLSAPVSIVVIASIRRSVNALKQATVEISGGSFDHQPDLSGNDEFVQLASDFGRMGRKLRELEQLRLDANPLTRLPGNLAIDRELDRRIGAREPFSHLYIDLDNFKAYSDRYGYNAGSDVLARVGEMIERVVRRDGDPEDLIGHIGGDDYVVVTTPELGEPLSQQLIEEFNEMVPSFYTEEDRASGSFVGKDRFGIERTFPLMTVSIALIRSDHYDYPSRLAISQDCARLKEYLKEQQGSNYMLDRRK
ncbi:diguanylate cyclase (GGDEF) domain-containing protein [Malonomonas rubra DSM 5091]|uniref:diguanylate cyclase n=1 Tax=Malonomonas rubra DSM 5091 TaxID=1122189 RepID=A0A1M6C3P6_MALRU|nr:sensor domain-containing diguanylate cyclase [Malonomonas rubra]SHI55646.1 diguanylate cyclase (GGDEF) domain-containing protein [Malonomonas rubra DSM 5091]